MHLWYMMIQLTIVHFSTESRMDLIRCLITLQYTVEMQKGMLYDTI